MIHGKYRLDALVGIGGMAAVYMATHRNGSVSALKILHDDVASNEEVRQRFLREAYIANKVGHEGTVKVLDDDVDENNTPFLVMELLTGQSVEALAESEGGRLSVDRTLDICDATLAVLEAAHGQKIIHRDLKPENLFMTAKGVVKVLDFGIARLREENARKTQTGMVMGTPSFMAPEQAMGRWSEVDGRTDLYALGATAFTLLTGLPVHEAETAGEMLVAAATRPARSLARVLHEAPYPLVAWVDKALAYERDKRFGDATAMRQELTRLRRGLDGEASVGEVRNDAKPMISPTIAGNAELSADDLVDYDERDELVDSYDPSENTDAEIASMAEVFTALERALVAIKQYGREHPETRRRFSETFRELASALMNCDICLAWNLAPYGFIVGEQSVWEPEPPWNRIPYQLFSDGVRTIGFVPGLDEEEFQRWVSVIIQDPTEDFSPEDDMVTQIWDAGFMHIFHQAVDSFAEGTQEQRARFEADRLAVIRGAREQPDQALAAAWQEQQGRVDQNGTVQRSRDVINFLARGEQVDTETAARVNNLDLVTANDDLTEDADIGLDGSARTLLAARLTPDVQATSERFVYAAAQAFVTSARAGRSGAVSMPLKRAVDGLGRGEPRRAMDMILELREAIEIEGKSLETENLRERLTTEVLSTATLEEILYGSKDVTDDQLAPYMDALEAILACIQGEHFDSAIAFLPHAVQPSLQRKLLDFLQRTGRGHETQLGELFQDADVELGLKLVRILAAVGTDAAKEAITNATRSPHALVRIEAMGHLEGVSSLRVSQEMKKLLGDKDDSVRLATLKTIEEHQIGAAGPFLVIRIQDKEFIKAPRDERVQCLRTLKTLKAQRCEEVCLTWLQESSWLRSEALDSTRVLAAEFLGEIATTNKAFFALEAVANGKGWKDARRVKDAAAAALARVRERAKEIEAHRRSRAEARRTAAGRRKRGKTEAGTRRPAGSAAKKGMKTTTSEGKSPTRSARTKPGSDRRNSRVVDGTQAPSEGKG